MPNENLGQSFTTKSIGDFAEDMACAFLEKRGYEIIARNIQESNKEIDIITKKGQFYVFVEVRSRTNLAFGGAEESMGRKKVLNFRFAVRRYVRRKNIDFNFVRLDFLAVDIDRRKKLIKIKHFEDIA